MSTRHRFVTPFAWEDRNGDEVEARVRVIYSATQGCEPSFDDSGSPDEIEIISIAPVGSEVEIPMALYTDDRLLDECAEDWAAEAEEAAEWHAQARRDDALMDTLARSQQSSVAKGGAK